MGKPAEVVATEKKTRAVVEAYIKAWATNDRAALLSTFAEDALWFDPVGTPPWEGHAGIGKFWDQARGGGAQLEPRVHRIVVCGNEAILLFKMNVRNPGGGGMGLELCDHMTINEHGKIQVAKAFWDEACVASPD